jgi:hypothetical protein
LFNTKQKLVELIFEPRLFGSRVCPVNHCGPVSVDGRGVTCKSVEREDVPKSGLGWDWSWGCIWWPLKKLVIQTTVRGQLHQKSPEPG